LGVGPNAISNHGAGSGPAFGVGGRGVGVAGERVGVGRDAVEDGGGGTVGDGVAVVVGDAVAIPCALMGAVSVGAGMEGWGPIRQAKSSTATSPLAHSARQMPMVG
jgi:hypothetical protein